MQFASAVSRELDPIAAGRSLVDSVRACLGGGTVDLACLFLSAHHADRAGDVAGFIGDTLRPRLLLGCTGEGVISGDQEIERAAAVTLWAGRLPGADLTPLRLSFEEERFTVAGWPERLTTAADNPTFLLFADPFSTPMDDVLSMVEDECPGALAVGGMAGGGSDLGENRLILNDAVYESGLVGAAIVGPVEVRTIVSQGCRPIGERYVVTKAERNVIHELGGVPALERLQSMFESLSNEERNLVQNALHVGIVMDEQRNRFERGDFLVRNLIGADRTSGSVAIGDMIKEGQTVQFHVRDAHSASEDLHLLLAADRARHKKPALGGLLFSCCGRGRGLFGRPHHDVSVVRERIGEIPLAGFFAQGEIGPVGRTNFLHGYTASLALFSEPGT
ncbi:FIST signal transduction protein [Candidatus Nitrospira bockiana]